MIIGEFQIVEQLKEAYDFSYRHKMLGPILNRMVQKSLETGKFIRTNTQIDKGAVSVSYAAVEKVHKSVEILEPEFLCVGLGETSKLSIKHLHQKDYSNIKIANRTDSKSLDFAREQLDSFASNYRNGQPLVQKVFRTEREVPMDDYLGAKNLYLLLKDEKEYKIRVETGASISVYTNNDTLLYKLIDKLENSIHGIWRPAPAVGPVSYTHLRAHET